MNTTSASRAERTAHAVREPRILVWDAPVRVFHWLMVACFAGAWLTAESERWRQLHATLGYTMAGLVAFRLVWGLVGTRHARFASFVRAPRAVRRYLYSLASAKPEHHTGHNPAGALAIVGMLGLAIAVTFTGWATFEDVWAGWPEALHEGASDALMALVLLHVLAVGVSSWLHRENLVAAMLTGRKSGPPADGVHRAWRGLATLMIAAVLVFWRWQWQSPTGAPRAGEATAHATHPGGQREPSRRDDDD